LSKKLSKIVKKLLKSFQKVFKKLSKMVFGSAGLVVGLGVWGLTRAKPGGCTSNLYRLTLFHWTTHEPLKQRTVHLNDNTILYESKVSVQNVFP
jgi:hypothetical protein